MEHRYVLAGSNAIIVSAVFIAFAALNGNTTILGVSIATLILGIVLLSIGSTYEEPIREVLKPYVKDLTLFVNTLFEDSGIIKNLHTIVYVNGLEVMTRHAFDKSCRPTGTETMATIHPDWLQTDLNGNPIVYSCQHSDWLEPDWEDAWMSPCSGYRDFFKNRIKSLAGAGVDGIYIDATFLPGYQEKSEETRWGSTDNVFSDLFFVEVLDEEGRPVAPGESGELVITDLSNYYMPFIRYRTGDIVVLSDRGCSCGRGYPLLEKVEGRAFDVVRTPGGKVVGGFFWTWLSRAVPGIRKFQIVQRELGGVIFNIVPGDEWRDEYRGVLEEKIKDNCGNDFKVAFIIKDDIPLTASGKMRFIVSEMSEKSYIKSKIHKARVTGIEPDGVDCIKIDSMLMELANIAPYEKVLIVDITNGSRVETFVMPEESESGKIVACGSVSGHIKGKDELSIMAFTWSSLPKVPFKNILVDDNNRFVRYLSSEEGND